MPIVLVVYWRYLINLNFASGFKIKSLAKSFDIELSLGNEVFIYPTTEESVFNPKYISVFNYYQLIEFENFVKKYSKLEEEEIDYILNASGEFLFLRKIKEKVPNFLAELRTHGAKPVAIIYLNERLFGDSLEV